MTLTNTTAGLIRDLKQGLFGDGTSVMMSLGPLDFGIRTAEYESLKTSMSWRWAEKARYLREPALQYQGPGVITKTLEIVIVVEGAEDTGYLKSWQQAAQAGVPHRLIAGHSTPVGGALLLASGSDMGLWCITDLSYDESNFMRDGQALLVAASLTIKSYGEDKHTR